MDIYCTDTVIDNVRVSNPVLIRHDLNCLGVHPWGTLHQNFIVDDMESVPYENQRIICSSIRKVDGNPFVVIHLRVYGEHIVGVLILEWGILVVVQVYIPVTK